MTMRRGSSLCRSVRFKIAGELPPPDACHCVSCRKWTGHFLVSADVRRDALVIECSELIGWYVSSEKVRRGFCSRCGSTLFFDPLDQVKNDWIAVAMGALESPTDTESGEHIFVREKGDYDEILDDAEQKL